MKTKIILDASVVIKLLIHEADSDRAHSIYQFLLSSKIDILAPEFLTLEIYNVLLQKLVFKYINLKEFDLLINLTNRLNIELKKNNSIMESACKLAIQLDNPGIYDCLYLAIAKELDSIILTEDKKFLNKAKKFYKRIYNMEEFLISINS